MKINGFKRYFKLLYEAHKSLVQYDFSVASGRTRKAQSPNLAISITISRTCTYLFEHLCRYKWNARGFARIKLSYNVTAVPVLWRDKQHLIVQLVSEDDEFLEVFILHQNCNYITQLCKSNHLLLRLTLQISCSYQKKTSQLSAIIVFLIKFIKKKRPEKNIT